MADACIHSVIDKLVLRAYFLAAVAERLSVSVRDHPAH